VLTLETRSSAGIGILTLEGVYVLGPFRGAQGFAESKEDFSSGITERRVKKRVEGSNYNDSGNAEFVPTDSMVGCIDSCASGGLQNRHGHHLRIWSALKSTRPA
jgi:hypothetical protein